MPALFAMVASWQLQEDFTTIQLQEIRQGTQHAYNSVSTNTDGFSTFCCD